MKIFNPFIKIEGLNQQELVVRKEYINSGERKCLKSIASISIDREMTWEEVFEAFKKLNPLYPVHSALSKRPEFNHKAQDVVALANKHYYKFVSNVMDVYQVNILTTAKMSSRKRKYIAKGVPRFLNLFTRDKDYRGAPTNYFTIDHSENMMTQLEEMHREAEKEIKDFYNEVKGLYFKFKVPYEIWNYGVNGILFSYLSNLKLIQDLQLEIVKTYGVVITCKLVQTIKCMKKAMINNIEFLLKRKYATYPEKKKKRINKDFVKLSKKKKFIKKK